MGEIERFIDTYSNDKTKATYRNNLENYFQFLNVNPNNYFKVKRDFEKDITDWWNYNLKKAPLTALARLSCVNLFLEENDVIIPNKLIRRLKRKKKGKNPVTLDRIPTNSELKTILSHGGILEKALFLTACSSGMRINEILNLEEDDIDFDTDPAKVDIPSKIAKFGRPRYCFISNEAKESMKSWLKIRDEYLENSSDRTNKRREPITKKNKEDNTIFCLSYPSANRRWHNILEKSGFNQRDKSTELKIHRLHIHTLRKFFKTRMLNAGVQEPIIKEIIGQVDSLGRSYNRFTEKDLIEGYKQGVNSLIIFESQPDLTRVHQELREKDEQIKGSIDRINKLEDIIAKLVEREDKNVLTAAEDDAIQDGIMKKVEEEIKKKMKPGERFWRCNNCGHITIAIVPPKVCPECRSIAKKRRPKKIVWKEHHIDADNMLEKIDNDNKKMNNNTQNLSCRM
jgi:integrase